MNRLKAEALLREAGNVLTRDEIIGCFERAFLRLDDYDRDELRGLLEKAQRKFKNVGVKSAYELIGKIAVNEAQGLERTV